MKTVNCSLSALWRSVEIIHVGNNGLQRFHFHRDWSKSRLAPQQQCKSCVLNVSALLKVTTLYKIILESQRFKVRFEFLMSDHVRLQFSWPFMFFRKVPGKAFFPKICCQIQLLFWFTQHLILLLHHQNHLHLHHIHPLYHLYQLNLHHIHHQHHVHQLQHHCHIHQRHPHHIHTWHTSSTHVLTQELWYLSLHVFGVVASRTARASHIFESVSWWGFVPDFRGWGFGVGGGWEGQKHLVECVLRWCYPLRSFLLLSEVIDATL